MFQFLIVILVYHAEYKLVRILSYSPSHKHISHLLESLSCEFHRVTLIQ